MRTLKFKLESTLKLDMPIAGHYFTLRIKPLDDPAQEIELEKIDVTPCDSSIEQRDGWGNALFVGQCMELHDSFAYEVAGTAIVDSAKGRGSELNLAYRYASPLTHPGPALIGLHEFAGTFAAADDPAAVFQRAIDLRGVVHDQMSYVPGVTDVRTTAEQSADMRQGVCQDYAQILCALLRMDGIPARYVCGLMWGEGATHAWVEFFDGTTWWGEDPTNDCEAGDYYIALARGRDHGDCAMERGIFRGGAMQRQITNVTVEEIAQ